MRQALHIPKILPTTIVGSDPRLMAVLTTAYGRNGLYLPVLEGPRQLPFASDLEVVRVSNVIARLKPARVFFANVPNSTQALFQPGIRARAHVLTRVDDTPEWAALRTRAQFRWGERNLAYGVLGALRRDELLTLVDDGPTTATLFSGSGHIVVCEDGDELAQALAAGYAFALRAGIHIIPTPGEGEASDLLETLYGCQEQSDKVKILARVTARIRELAGALPSASEITFFTSGLPWGIAFPAVPSTHLFSRPRLGEQIALGVVAEQSGAPGIRTAVVIQPGSSASSELDAARATLGQNGVFTKQLVGESATVYQARYTIDHFPYDLLLISTHCDDAKGERCTFEFSDSGGRRRTLVVDRALSPALVPGTDHVDLGQFITFISLDGVAWSDTDGKARLPVGTAIVDFMNLIKDQQLQPVQRQSTSRVRLSMALRMADGLLVVAPDSVGGTGMPLVISNACGSWHRLAAAFMAAGARGYIGTAHSVIEPEAQEIGKRILDDYIGLPLALALSRAQQKTYGDQPRRPYLMVGCHFQRIQISRGPNIDYVLSELQDASHDCGARSLAPPLTTSATRLRAIADYLDSEVEAIEAWRRG